MELIWVSLPGEIVKGKMKNRFLEKNKIFYQVSA